jgi:hypothetical protein
MVSKTVWSNAVAFADPQSVTINAVAQSMPRTGTGPSSGTFTKDDAAYQLTVSHDVKKRARRTLRLSGKKLVADAIVPAQNVQASMSCYIVVDAPLVGYTNAELKLVIDGFLTYLTASSGAKITQLLGGEN